MSNYEFIRHLQLPAIRNWRSDMNLARAFHRRRHGTGYSNGNAVTFTGVSGSIGDRSVPGPTDSWASFQDFFEKIRVAPETDESDVGKFGAAIDNWGAAVVAGEFNPATQAQAYGAHKRLVQVTNDPYNKFVLQQAYKTLQSADQVGPKTADPVRQAESAQAAGNPALQSTLVGAGAGAGVGMILAIGIGIYFLLSKK